jgi:hypothetical protein
VALHNLPKFPTRNAKQVAMNEDGLRQLCSSPHFPPQKSELNAKKLTVIFCCMVLLCKTAEMFSEIIPAGKIFVRKLSTLFTAIQNPVILPQTKRI